jgi:hypothetical protein
MLITSGTRPMKHAVLVLTPMIGFSADGISSV